MEYERMIKQVLQKKELNHLDQKSKEEIIESLTIYHEELYFQNEELKGKNQELQRHREYYKRLFDESPIIYFHVDPKGGVLEYNQLAETYFGFLQPIDDISKIFDRNSQDHFYFYKKSLHEKRNQGEHFKVNATFGIRDVRLFHRISEMDQTVYYTMIDITREMEQLQVIHETKNQAVLLNDAKNRFLSRISHELRNPINSLYGLLEVYEDLNPLYYKAAKAQLNQLLYLINDTLDYSRYESGKVDIQKKQVDVTEFFDTLVDSHQQAIREKGLVIYTDNRLPQDATMFMDYAKMLQIMDNLIINAIKYTDTGSITLKMETGEKATIITVSDTGIGIKKEHISRIFSPFEQIPSGKDQLQKGVGLGLSIAQELVQAMGCSIDVHSELGKGSDFRVLLPLDLYPLTMDSSVDDPSFPPEAEQVGKRTYRPESEKEISILLVEDDPVNRMILSKVLERQQYTFDVAHNGQEALDLVTKKKYDIIFMDCQMPVLDGYEATRLIRQQEGSQSIRIVAMTAYAQEGDREKCFYYGMDDYISKPITDYEVIFDKIRKIPIGKH